MARPAQDEIQTTSSFYRLLRQEVRDGNPGLSAEQQERLQSHYPVLMQPQHYPADLVTAIYTQRRAPAVATISTSEDPVVFDAGCGYGSESFLFAATGARVLAVDRSQEQIDIARRRQPFFEEHLGKSLDIEFRTSDLDSFDLDRQDLSLTWLASVLAGVCDQDRLLRRVHAATRPGGEIQITDMNLLNPLFVFKEWRRRRRMQEVSAEFARQSNYLAMLQRRGRRGARYYPSPDGDLIDDVQFFRPGTLANLLRGAGFVSAPAEFSGFIPPISAKLDHARWERWLACAPGIRRFGYFYWMRGRRADAASGASGGQG